MRTSTEKSSNPIPRDVQRHARPPTPVYLCMGRIIDLLERITRDGRPAGTLEPGAELPNANGWQPIALIAQHVCRCHGAYLDEFVAEQVGDARVRR